VHDSLRSFLGRLHAALLAIGTANDCLDHGSAEESERIYQEAQRAIREAFDQASADDLEIVRHLLGPRTAFDRYSWGRPWEDIGALLAEDPDISLPHLRDRLPRFAAEIAALRASAGATTRKVRFRHRATNVEPSLLEGFLLLVTKESGRPTSYHRHEGGVFTTFYLNLRGEGFTLADRDRTFVYDALVSGVWLHCREAMGRRVQEVALTSEDAATRHRIERALAKELARRSWEPVRREPRRR
jgi:hypothetical protein